MKVMLTLDECETTTCAAAATHRFTWPGHDEQKACEPCAARARAVAAALGLHLQVLRVEGKAEEVGAKYGCVLERMVELLGSTPGLTFGAALEQACADRGHDASTLPPDVVGA